MAVIGTAGHVDHGKSTLLEAITGRDPDRWEEEKRRGLTIDLGFVWSTLPSGREVSFVDVPGHERFIKNMLAGIEAIDAALFVVAADEGWMPQSEEHLAVLDLLGIDRGVVAVTKVDRVDADLVELAILETSEKLEGTSLESSPVLPVSGATGAGLAELLQELDAALPNLPPPTEPRMWVDRRFVIPGAGTVVTGTLLGGSVAIGDNLVAYPRGETLRIRAIESHEQHLETVSPHRRVALNVVGATEDIGRGTMLGIESHWLTTDRFTARLRPARYVEDLTERGAYHVHLGSTGLAARLRMFDDSALVILDHPLPVRYGDRFILRETGRRAVVAGGTVLDPAPPARGKPLRKATAIAPGLQPDEAADALLDLRGVDSLARLFAHTGGRPGRAVVIGDTAVTETELARLVGHAEKLVRAFHAEAPLRPGLPMATLASQLEVTAELAEQVVEASPRLHAEGGVAFSADHRAVLTADHEEAWWRARRELEDSGLTPPRLVELGLDLELVHELVRRGELVRVSDDLVFLPATIAELRTAIAAMPDEFTVAEFRDRHSLSRKYAVPILEWSDRQNLTMRRGDRRSPRR